jgi:thiol-disulfide isomerase/thioredoxin
MFILLILSQLTWPTPSLSDLQKARHVLVSPDTTQRILQQPQRCPRCGRSDCPSIRNQGASNFRSTEPDANVLPSGARPETNSSSSPTGASTPGTPSSSPSVVTRVSSARLSLIDERLSGISRTAPTLIVLGATWCPSCVSIKNAFLRYALPATSPEAPGRWIYANASDLPLPSGTFYPHVIFVDHDELPVGHVLKNYTSLPTLLHLTPVGSSYDLRIYEGSKELTNFYKDPK